MLSDSTVYEIIYYFNLKFDILSPGAYNLLSKFSRSTGSNRLYSHENLMFKFQEAFLLVAVQSVFNSDSVFCIRAELNLKIDHFIHALEMAERIYKHNRLRRL